MGLGQHDHSHEPPFPGSEHPKLLVAVQQETLHQLNGRLRNRPWASMGYGGNQGEPLSDDPRGNEPLGLSLHVVKKWNPGRGCRALLGMVSLDPKFSHISLRRFTGKFPLKGMF